jgi:tetratricopeptide (TPR) repeat protein
MKTTSLFTTPAILMLFLLSGSVATQAQPANQPKVSEAEAKALTAINAAPDATAKLTGAEEFVKKYPKSAAIPQLAQELALEIGRLSDANQKLLLADRFDKAFTDEKALAQIQFARMDSYLALNKMDEAFALAAKILEKNPEELHTMVQMTLSGTEAAKKGNGKYATQSQQYGLKAIQIIESNQKPASVDEATWASDKATLPILYQQTAILAMMTGNMADAKTRLAKAVTLNPSDPSNHAFAGYIVNNEYVQLASTYKTMPEGKPKEEMLKKLEGMIDNIIDEFAQAVALATGRKEYEPLLQQLTPDLTSYYKFRHNQSVEGLQQLIDKYKPQPKP